MLEDSYDLMAHAPKNGSADDSGDLDSDVCGRLISRVNGLLHRRTFHPFFVLILLSSFKRQSNSVRMKIVTSSY